MEPSGQSASVTGSSNIAVNAFNSAVTIAHKIINLFSITFHIGSAREPILTLYEDRAATAAKIDSEAGWLSAYRTDVVELIGRNVEIAALQAWLDDARPLSVRVLIGSAGRGKTRLAGELARAARRAGWDAGFVGGEDFETFAGARGKPWPRKKPTVVIVDYAAGRGKALQGWLDELCNAPKDGPKLRLLLLERQAQREIGWLAELIGRGGDKARARAAVFNPAEPVELAPLGETEGRRALFLALFRRGGGTQALGADFDARLAEPKWGGDPLFLMMAGLVAAKAGVAALSLSRADLAFEIADGELERIGRIGAAHGIDANVAPPGRSLRRLAALTTLVQGLAVPDARRLAETLHPGGDPEAMVRALRDALPRAEAGAEIGPILPDMVGEAAILRIYGEGGEIAEAGGETDAAVLKTAATAISLASATLVRAAQDFAAAGYLAPIRWLEALADAPETDLGARMQIADALPNQTLALREMAVRLLEKIHSELVEARKISAGDGGLDAALATALNNLGAFLSDLGRREDALHATQEAVDIRRTLAAARPDAFLPDLASALNNLGNRLSDLGRREDALNATQEAVDTYRTLAAARPDAFLPDLAGALNNLGIRLSELGRREDALKATQEAVDTYRTLAAARPDAFLPDLAMALNNLGNRLSNLGRREDALNATQEAVNIRRTLAAARPDAFLPDLAQALNNLGDRWHELDRPEDAHDAAKEAVRVLAPFFLKLPRAYAGQMDMMRGDYVARCEALGREPDMDLLAPIAAAFEALQTAKPEPET